MFAADEAVQFIEYALAGRVVHGIDGGELAAGPAWGILGIPAVQGQRAAKELERELPRHAVVKELAEYSFRIIEASRHMDLPALGRERAARRHVQLPLTEARPGPACR